MPATSKTPSRSEAGLPETGFVFAGYSETHKIGPENFDIWMLLLRTELVTTSLAEYEDVARTLAQNPARLAAIKAKLIRNRNTEPLFDTVHFTRDLESAYSAMWERQRVGLPPTSIALDGSPRV